jgi:YesN/AraC family two-component response regulator
MKNINAKELYKLTKDLSVLYVEDDLAFSDQTTDILEDFFLCVDTAYNGVEGLNSYKDYYVQNDKYYDLVISDINMPKMDGIELTKEIYKINDKQPVIIVSAYNESEYLVELINIGVERFLQKPFKHDQLLEILFFILNKKSKDQCEIDLGENTVWNKTDQTVKVSNEIIKLI